MTKVFSGTSTQDRMDLIANQINAGLLDEDLHLLASDIVSECPAKDEFCELKAIFEWGKKNIRYLGEIQEVDIYRTPQMTIKMKAGDCDCMTALFSCLTTIIGYQTRGRVVSEDGDNGTHIYPVIGYPRMEPKKWIAMDVAEGPRLGWEPRNVKWYQDFEFQVVPSR